MGDLHPTDAELVKQVIKSSRSQMQDLLLTVGARYNLSAKKKGKPLAFDELVKANKVSSKDYQRSRSRLLASATSPSPDIDESTLRDTVVRNLVDQAINRERQTLERSGRLKVSY